MSSLESLLTKFVVGQIEHKSIEDILKILTSNCESPYLIWNHKCRAELKDYLEQQIENAPNFDPGFGASFVYGEHKNELIISDVFIRVYNEQPSFKIEVCFKNFWIQTVDFDSKSLKISSKSNFILGPRKVYR